MSKYIVPGELNALVSLQELIELILKKHKPT